MVLTANEQKSLEEISSDVILWSDCYRSVEIPKYLSPPKVLKGCDQVFPGLIVVDQSSNPTGTHKDWMAWRVALLYRDFLIAKEKGRSECIPEASLLSSGSAGFGALIELARIIPSDARIVIVNTGKSLV